MIRSMTGFGKEVVELPGKHITIEIKSLNSKQIDIYLRIPACYKEKEPEIRQIVSNLLERGKVEISLSTEDTSTSSNHYLNIPLIEKYYAELSELSKKLGESHESLLPVIIRLPDVIRFEMEQVDEHEWDQISAAFKKALEQLNTFRSDEGSRLASDLKAHIENIQVLHKEIHDFEDARIQAIKGRIREKLNEIKENIKLDENRFEQELIYYMEKLDITEENVRLEKHCNYFIDTLIMGGSVGRKLTFITQEIGREINTIGSKANDADIQKRVVLMKDELEKIKEQLYNIL